MRRTGGGRLRARRPQTRANTTRSMRRSRRTSVGEDDAVPAVMCHAPARPLVHAHVTVPGAPPDPTGPGLRGAAPGRPERRLRTPGPASDRHGSRWPDGRSSAAPSQSALVMPRK